MLGHRRIDTTLIYARVHDRTVAEDYYAAMARIEKGSDLSGKTEDFEHARSLPDQAQLLALVNQLAEPRVEAEARLQLVAQLRHLLDGSQTAQVVGAPAFPS